MTPNCLICALGGRINYDPKLTDLCLDEKRKEIHEKLMHSGRALFGNVSHVASAFYLRSTFYKRRYVPDYDPIRLAEINRRSIQACNGSVPARFARRDRRSA